MSKKSRVGSFRGKISSNDERKKRGGSFPYISTPDGIEIFTPEVETTYTFDFIPYEVHMKNHPDRDDKNGVATPGDWWYKLPFRVHKQIGVKNEKVVCPQSFGKPCPVCDYRLELKKKDGDEDEIKELNTSDRNLYAVYIRGNKKLKEKIYLYDASDFKFQEEFRSQLKTDERWQTFPHPVEGCSVKVIYDEASFAGNKYAEPTRFDFVDRRKELDDSLLDEVPNLEKCLNVLSYEQLKAKFFEAEIEEDEEEEEKPKKKVEKGKKPVVVEEEEDDEEEEDENDEEDDEEEEKSLTDEINACKSVGALLTVATNNKEFKSSLKSLNKMIKTSELKKAMLEILEPEEEEEEEEEEEKPKRRRQETKEESASKKSGSVKCPNGHKFGTDNEEYDDCEDCELWKPCYKKQKEG